jgi:hypothetical protein
LCGDPDEQEGPRSGEFIDIEPGTHDSVSSEVKSQLPTLTGKFRSAGIRLAIYEGVKGIYRWLRDRDWGDFEDWL